MRAIFTTISLALIAVSAFAADNFIVDKNHSEATFQVRHLVSRVSGRFNDFSGAISVDEANPAVSSVEFTIKAPSIDTGNDSRDKDLRSANFFEVAGVQPVLGRGFQAGEDQPGRDRDVVLSDRLWRNRFGADRSIVVR